MTLTCILLFFVSLYSQGKIQKENNKERISLKILKLMFLLEETMKLEIMQEAA